MATSKSVKSFKITLSDSERKEMDEEIVKTLQGFNIPEEHFNMLKIKIGVAMRIFIESLIITEE